MSSTDRQNRLLVAEDWKRIYQSYKNADFVNYDFDNLRRVMIGYLRENYPEDFNDYIESSEYIALIDLIAFLGQNIAFRIDLNARENYLELAERRESVLRLARLISYNPKRNIAAFGLLKIASIRTTETLVDSNNTNLSNQNIIWNDPSNPNWYEQFIKVFNKACLNNEKFGKPVKTELIDNVRTEKYRFNTNDLELPMFDFSRVVDGKSLRFEVVASDIDNGKIKEQAPVENGKFSVLYREDGSGAASSNTGFFCYFVQGLLDQANFTVDNPSPNQIVTIDTININNTDVWLYELDKAGNLYNLWTKVNAVEGNNIIYNSLSKKIRKIYGIQTRTSDRISLIFADGVFGDLPVGNFRVYYRISDNSNISIKPKDIAGVGIDFTYISENNKVETMSLTLELKSSIDNASTSETNLSIKQRAPMTYYTQNRLITGEDYQIGPLSISQELIKVKSVNRFASGLSRYYDVIDTTGKYSSTTLFGTDGILYKENLEETFDFVFETETDIESIIINQIEPILKSSEVRNYYYDNITPVPYTDQGLTWNLLSEDTNNYSGYFVNPNNIKQVLGTYTTSILTLIRNDCQIKFTAPEGYHFTPDRNLKLGTANYKDAREFLWIKVFQVIGNGIETQENGQGPVIFSDKVPNGAILSEIRPYISKILTDDVKLQIIEQIFAYQTFGIRFDRTVGQWKIILEENLDTVNNFSLGKAGDNTAQGLDSSWLVKISYSKNRYIVSYRKLNYIFESQSQIKFLFDSTKKIYDAISGKTVKDKITILGINNKPYLNTEEGLQNFTIDFDWKINNDHRDVLGYVINKQLELDFFDNDDDGVVDDPEIFTTIVNHVNEPLNSYIFQKKFVTMNGVERFEYIDNDIENIEIISSVEKTGPLSQYVDGQIFYFINENLFNIYNQRLNLLEITSEYKAFVGRDKLKFKYFHAADDSNRIDPSSTNLIDVYVLTKSYDEEFRKYLFGIVETMPLPLSSDQLYINYGQQVDEIKSLTDELIYHPAKYRILFGPKADSALQARFAIVKNPEIVLNDNDVKASVISYINQFFTLDNWEFGETFYFSELSAYVLKEAAPNIVSFLIIPVQSDQSFGSLHEIGCEDNEIFISDATVDNLDIIDSVTADKIKAAGNIVTNAGYQNYGITSASY